MNVWHSRAADSGPVFAYRPAESGEGAPQPRRIPQNAAEGEHFTTEGGEKRILELAEPAFQTTSVQNGKADNCVEATPA
jgi:hypothetical protein